MGMVIHEGDGREEGREVVGLLSDCEQKVSVHESRQVFVLGVSS